MFGDKDDELVITLRGSEAKEYFALRRDFETLEEKIKFLVDWTTEVLTHLQAIEVQLKNLEQEGN